MSSVKSDEPVEPVEPMLSVEGLNYLVFAMLHVTAQRMGPEFMPEVMAFAEQIRGEREVTIALRSDL